MNGVLRAVGSWLRGPVYGAYSELAGCGECAFSSLEMSVEAGAEGSCDNSCGEESSNSKPPDCGSWRVRPAAQQSTEQQQATDPRDKNPEDLEDEDLEDIPPPAE